MKKCLPDGNLELHPVHFSIHEIFGMGSKTLNKTKSKSNKTDDERIQDVIKQEDEATKGKSNL